MVCILFSSLREDRRSLVSWRSVEERAGYAVRWIWFSESSRIVLGQLSADFRNFHQLCCSENTCWPLAAHTPATKRAVSPASVIRHSRNRVTFIGRMAGHENLWLAWGSEHAGHSFPCDFPGWTHVGDKVIALVWRNKHSESGDRIFPCDVPWWTHVGDKDYRATETRASNSSAVSSMPARRILSK